VLAQGRPSGVRAPAAVAGVALHGVEPCRAGAEALAGARLQLEPGRAGERVVQAPRHGVAGLVGQHRASARRRLGATRAKGRKQGAAVQPRPAGQHVGRHLCLHVLAVAAADRLAHQGHEDADADGQADVRDPAHARVPPLQREVVMIAVHLHDSVTGRRCCCWTTEINSMMRAGAGSTAAPASACRRGRSGSPQQRASPR